jgi:hypothetical protein
MECSVMKHSRRFDATKPPLGLRRCPNCGLPMFLSSIEAIEGMREDLRTFECQQCAYAETMVVELA